MFDVITIGSATVDVFADTDSELIKIVTSKGEEDFLAYPSGSKILIKHLAISTGGGGTNTAVGFSRMGLKTAYLGMLGSDENAQTVLKELRKEKVKFIGEKTDDVTGYSVILDSIEHDRTILTYKGANDKLDFSKIKKSSLKAKYFYFSSMMGKSYDSMVEIAKLAKKQKSVVAFNPSSYLAKNGISYLKEMLKNTDILILNKEEANLVLGMVHATPNLLIKGLHMAGPKYVLITDGNVGVYASNGKEAMFIPSHKIQVVEATGAGDAYACGFTCAMQKTNDFKLSLKIAMVNAESVLTHKGAKNKLLKWKEALDKINQEKFEFHKL